MGPGVLVWHNSLPPSPSEIYMNRRQFIKSVAIGIGASSVPVVVRASGPGYTALVRPGPLVTAVEPVDVRVCYANGYIYYLSSDGEWGRILYK